MFGSQLNKKVESKEKNIIQEGFMESNVKAKRHENEIYYWVFESEYIQVYAIKIT